MSGWERPGHSEALTRRFGEQSAVHVYLSERGVVSDREDFLGISALMSNNDRLRVGMLADEDCKTAQFRRLIDRSR